MRKLSVCKDERNRQWREAHKEHIRLHGIAYREKNKERIAEQKRQYRMTEESRIRRSLQKKQKAYGISPEAFLEMFEKQGRCCAICKSTTPRSKNGWSTDHDHLTGVVRGILCNHCNVVLGHATDSVEVLESCIRYLRANAVRNGN